MDTEDRGLDRLNALPAGQADAALLTCCASPVWTQAVVIARPFADRATFLAHADAVLAQLSWAELRVAIDAHPRIGERVGGASPEAAWSRREQAGVAATPDAVRAELAEANMAYERRFGHVFLIFASGATDVRMLAAARERLGHDEPTEHAVVRAELASIVTLRLSRLLDERLADG